MRGSAAADLPLRELWDVCIHTTDSRLTSEFMALAHRSESLRQEVIYFIEESRRIQAQAVKRALAGTGFTMPLGAEGAALLATGIALAMTREAALGITMGHASLLSFIESLQERLEPRL